MGSPRRRASAFTQYGAAAAMSMVAAAILLELGKADLHVPFSYGGDALLFALIVKSTVDHGWFWTNPSVGAPGGLDLRDFPVSSHDTFHVLLVRIMSWFSGDWAFLFNAYFLLGFPLITLSAVAVFRHFRAGYGPAIVGGVLYSFLPSRLLKGQGHLFLDTFYQVPLAILVLLWVCSEQPPLTRDRGDGRWPGLQIRRPRSWGALLICTLISSTSIYYAFFTICLLVTVAIWASIERRSKRNAVAGAALAGVIVAGLAANGLPTMLYQRSHGPNAAVAERSFREAEVYGLKITQLLLPVEGHRLPALREIKRRYEMAAPLGGENGMTSLGIVGDVGFLALLAKVLSGRRSTSAEDEPMRPLAILNLTAVLLGTIGGFGSLFASLISPQIRTYCRLNVFIAFFSLFAVVLLLEQLARRHRRLCTWALPLVLALGLLDQATPLAVRPYAATKKEYLSDAHLVDRIEDVLPRGAAVFELPYVDFPEASAVLRVGAYDPIRPYLHSHTLRWSYPAMRGRPGDAWSRDVSQFAPVRMLETLAEAGFEGVLIDREGYADRGCGLEAAFRVAIGAEPVASEDGRLAFFSLPHGGGTQCHDGRCECGRLYPGQSLASGHTMSSCDGRFSLTMQVDGKLVLHGCGCPGGGACWSSGSPDHAGARLVMQGDGDLVVSGDACGGDTSPCWSSASGGHPGASLALQNDGNLCVSGAGCAGPNSTCWCTNTCCH